MKGDSRPEWKMHHDETEQVHDYSLSIKNRKIYLHSSYGSDEGDQVQTGEWLILLLKIFIFLKTPVMTL